MGVRWVEDWASIHILDWCKGQTQGFGLNPNDVETFNVHYDDCAEPWIMCRHKDAGASKQQMVEVRCPSLGLLGRLELSLPASAPN
jgi:hypothetical protein